MTKINLNRKQLTRGKKELDNGFKNSNEKISNARKMMFSGKKDVKESAKKTLREETERKGEIDELQKIFKAAISKAETPQEKEARRASKMASDKMDAARVNSEIKKMNREQKAFRVELNELELRLIIASLKRSYKAVKKGKINAAGVEYLERLIKDLEAIK